MKKTGFTLVELIIVIAIISILATVVMANLSTAKAKSRDARRIADISNVQLALALYQSKNGKYPSNIADWTALGTALNSYIVIPLDPLNTGTYKYSYSSADGSTYTMTADLEENNSLAGGASIYTVTK